MRNANDMKRFGFTTSFDDNTERHHELFNVILDVFKWGEYFSTHHELHYRTPTSHQNNQNVICYITETSRFASRLDLQGNLGLSAIGARFTYTNVKGISFYFISILLFPILFFKKNQGLVASICPILFTRSIYTLLSSWLFQSVSP